MTITIGSVVQSCFSSRRLRYGPQVADPAHVRRRTGGRRRAPCRRAPRRSGHRRTWRGRRRRGSVPLTLGAPGRRPERQREARMRDRPDVAQRSSTAGAIFTGFSPKRSSGTASSRVASTPSPGPWGWAGTAALRRRGVGRRRKVPARRRRTRARRRKARRRRRRAGSRRRRAPGSRRASAPGRSRQRRSPRYRRDPGPPGRARGGPDQQDRERDGEGDGGTAPVGASSGTGEGKSRFTGHWRSVPYLQAASKTNVHGAGIDLVAAPSRPGTRRRYHARAARP